MKNSVLLMIVFALLLCSKASGQRDKSEYSRFRLGIKFSAERAGWRAYSPAFYSVYNGGFQFVGRIKNSDWSLESGLYFTTKVPELNSDLIRFRYLNVPLNAKWEKNGIYIAGGVFTDYLILVNSGQSAYSPLDPKRTPGFGMNAAAGYEKNIYSNLNMMIELRYFRTIAEGYRRGFVSYGLALGLNCSI